MHKDSKLTQFICEKGKKGLIQATCAYELNEKSILYISSGETVNVFASEKDGEGNKQFILSASPGEIIFFFPENHKHYSNFKACSEGETEIYVLEESQLTQLIKSDLSLRTELVLEIKNWVEKLSAFAVDDRSDHKIHRLRPTENFEVNENERIEIDLSSLNTIPFVWVQVSEGELTFMGINDLKFHSSSCPCLVAENIWYQANVKTKLKVVDPIQFFDVYDFKIALITLTDICLYQLNLIAKEEVEEKKKLIAVRNKEERINLKHAVNKVRTFFLKREERAIRDEKDPLLNSLHVLSKYLNVPFTFPLGIEEQDEGWIRLSQICHASNIRYREVKLGEDWWKKDCGPLLAFMKEGNKPVVLIKKGSTNYCIIDEGKKIKVCKKISELITQTAYMFYEPFPTEIKSGLGIFKQIFSKYKKTFYSIIGYAFLASIIILLIPVGTNLIFNLAIPKNDPSLLAYISLGFISATIGFALFSFVRSIFSLRLEALVTHFVETAIWDRMLKLSPAFFRKYTVGNLFWRLFSMEEIRMYLTGNVTSMILSGVFSTFFLILMFFFSPMLASITLFFAVLSLAITIPLCYLKKKLITIALEKDGHIRGFLVQMILNVNKIKSAGVERNAFSKWCSSFADFKRIELKAQNIENYVLSLSATFPILTTLFVYVALIWWIDIVNFPLPDFLAFNIAFSSFIIGFFPLNIVLIRVVEVIPRWGRMQPIIEEELDSNLFISKDFSKGNDISGNIKVDNVVFGYSKDMPPIIQNLTFNVSPKEFVAIVGHSGNGKSTLMRLLLGFEKAQSGAIYYDNKDIESFDLTYLRKQIGVVFQDAGIMGGSIYSNITCGGKYSLDQIKIALEISDFAKDLKEMPMGLNTILPMNGVTLSGGQKQRLLLARALIGKPRLLLFDEATSALDNVTQNSVSENIAKLNVTRIVVAQRLSTVKKADKILVLQKGKIVQQGTFKVLSMEQGPFQDMLNFQIL